MAQNRTGGRASPAGGDTAKLSPLRAEQHEAPAVPKPQLASVTAASPRDMTAGRAIVEVLKAEGVKAVYGIPGGHVLPIYDGLYDTPEISHFLVRHEQAAASMAAAYAQLTGEAAVCLVTAGPGATNLVTNVAEAFVGALPMVILAGRGATATTFPRRQPGSGYRTGLSPDHQMGRAHRPGRSHSGCLARGLRRGAQRQAGSSLSRSAARYLAGEDQIRRVTCRPDRAARLRGEPERIGAAVGASPASETSADRCWRRHHRVGRFGGAATDWPRALSAPVITTLAGRGVIDDDHPLSVGGLGAHRNPLSKRLLAEADVVLSLGARFEEMETNWRAGFVPSPAARVIQVDIDAAEIGRSVPAQLGIVGDIRAVVEDMLVALRGGEPANRGGFRPNAATQGYAAELKRFAAEIAEQAASQDKPIHPLRVIRAVRQALPREATIAIDVGCLAQHMVGSLPAFPVHLPRSLIVPSSFYGMGFAGSALPVARQVYPDRPAVGFIGDGSFQMMLHVLPVAAEYRLGVTWCVLNDRALGSIRDIQEFGMGNRVIDTDFGVQPDFAKIAEACSCYGEQVTEPAEVDGAIARALAANEKGVPAVLDFIVARARMQQTYEHYAFYGSG